MNVALINTNRIHPPIAPIGLDYVAEALHAAGHNVSLLDLCWAEDVHRAIRGFFAGASFDLVGMTLRNTDDCAFTSRASFVDPFAALAKEVRRHTDARLVLGGVGFSVMPELVLGYLEREHDLVFDAGIWGEGEYALVELLARLEQDREWRDTPGLVCRREDGVWWRSPPEVPSLDELPPMTRRWVENARYFRWGGQAGIETKRGCSGACIYCADPLSKGARMRVRPPAAVVDELECLLAQDIDHIHTCDSEFNLPGQHVLDICAEIVRRGLESKLRWYAYCAPVPFNEEMAQAMAAAGCVGINFGADHGVAEMLRRLGRAYGPEDVVRATRLCHESGIVVMLDMLLGSPGETRESLLTAIECMQRAAPERVGISMGLRVYPGTPLEGQVAAASGSPGLSGGDEPAEPRFYLEPAVADYCFSLLDNLIGDDPRFLFFDPSKPAQNYNYNANQRLTDAIAEGYRGAYWDILRRLA
jgi:radical SAM superfamily enzyme YgiQ (UPF0313 family)